MRVRSECSADRRAERSVRDRLPMVCGGLWDSEPTLLYGSDALKGPRRPARWTAGTPLPAPRGDVRRQPVTRLVGADPRSVGPRGPCWGRLPNPRGRSGAGIGAAVRVVATECTAQTPFGRSSGWIARAAGARVLRAPSIARGPNPLPPGSCWVSAPPADQPTWASSARG